MVSRSPLPTPRRDDELSALIANYAGTATGGIRERLAELAGLQRTEEADGHAVDTLANLNGEPTERLYLGRVMFCSDCRKSGEGAGVGTGVPVWHDGTNWLTFYDNSTAAS